MKTKIQLILLSLMLVGSTGCNINANINPGDTSNPLGVDVNLGDNDNQGEVNVSDNQGEVNVSDNQVDNISEEYKLYLDDIYKIEYNGYLNKQLVHGEVGLSNLLQYYTNQKDSLSNIGYIINDFNNDGIDEMFICHNTFSPKYDPGTKIITAFTLNPQYGGLDCLFDKHSTCSYELIDNDTVLRIDYDNIEQVIEVLDIDYSNVELIPVEKYYAVEEHDTVLYKKLVADSNGIYGEEEDITLDEYNEVLANSNLSPVNLDITYFKDYKYEGNPEYPDITDKVIDAFGLTFSDNSKIDSVIIDDTDSTLEMFNRNETYIIDDGEYAIDILIIPSQPLRNICINELTFDEDENGEVIFYKDTIKDFVEIRPDVPLRIRLVINGAIPQYGISYVDPETNETVDLAITMSGMDGSIIFDDSIEIIGGSW